MLISLVNILFEWSLRYANWFGQFAMLGDSVTGSTRIDKQLVSENWEKLFE